MKHKEAMFPNKLIGSPKELFIILKTKDLVDLVGLSLLSEDFKD
jgi:hypothetical protein